MYPFPKIFILDMAQVACRRTDVFAIEDPQLRQEEHQFVVVTDLEDTSRHERWSDASNRLPKGGETLWAASHSIRKNKFECELQANERGRCELAESSVSLQGTSREVAPHCEVDVPFELQLLQGTQGLQRGHILHVVVRAVQHAQGRQAQIRGQPL